MKYICKKGISMYFDGNHYDFEEGKTYEIVDSHFKTDYGIVPVDKRIIDEFFAEVVE